MGNEKVDKIMGKFKYKVYKLLTKSKIIQPKVIVSLDGGICSQMHQYLLGRYYSDRGDLVYYDLSFYRTWGSDLTFQFARNFDLLKAFPYLPFREASETMISVYQRKYYNVGNNTKGHLKRDDYSFLQRTSPLYLGGYYQLPPKLWLDAFRNLFKIVGGVLDASNEVLCNKIKKNPSAIAVHVRRGDLKEEVFAYGKPATLEYFQRAVRFFQERVAASFFYFFSDEADWVTEELIPKLSLESNFEVIDINGSDRGYMDLFLIAYCKHQITSKGTLGKYGAVLMDCPEKYVVLCDDVTEYYWKGLLHNPHFL